jgi:hypothetical protein
VRYLRPAYIRSSNFGVFSSSMARFNSPGMVFRFIQITLETEKYGVLCIHYRDKGRRQGEDYLREC